MTYVLHCTSDWSVGVCLISSKLNVEMVGLMLEISKVLFISRLSSMNGSNFLLLLSKTASRSMPGHQNLITSLWLSR